MIGSPLLTFDEAAYLMNLDHEQLQALVDNDQILVIKSAGEDPPLIHESEVHRFVHPWQHIFRLDKRVDSLLALVETLKNKNTLELNESTNNRLENIEESMDEFRRDLRQIKNKLWPPPVVTGSVYTDGSCPGKLKSKGKSKGKSKK